ncbi:MAG: hypothetical protein ABI231_06470, partial [Candidatus Tumulicola sp.]
ARAMGHDLNAATMFVRAAAAHFSGQSSCAPLELAFETLEEQSGKIATISLAAWEHADMSESIEVSTPPERAAYAAA